MAPFVAHLAALHRDRCCDGGAGSGGQILFGSAYGKKLLSNGYKLHDSYGDVDDDDGNDDRHCDETDLYSSLAGFVSPFEY